MAGQEFGGNAGNGAGMNREESRKAATLYRVRVVGLWVASSVAALAIATLRGDPGAGVLFAVAGFIGVVDTRAAYGCAVLGIIAGLFIWAEVPNGLYFGSIYASGAASIALISWIVGPEPDPHAYLDTPMRGRRWYTLARQTGHHWRRHQDT